MDIVDLAYQIIYLHEENLRLERELDHYKELHRINCNSTKDSIEHNEKLIGSMLSAALDPDSVINKGYAAILREQER